MLGLATQPTSLESFDNESFWLSAYMEGIRGERLFPRIQCGYSAC
jgi:hypothetical protein